jgi:hypothetical protein
MKSKQLHLRLTSLLLALTLSACNGVGTAKFGDVAVGTGGNSIDETLIFSGITSVDEKSDTIAKLHWTPHADAINYDVFNTISGTETLIMTVAGQATAEILLTGLTPATTYKFRVRMRTSAGKNDGNTNDAIVAMNAAPDVPTGVALQTPNYTPGMDDTPTVRVSGVKAGDTIKLFTNNTCTTQVASGVAAGTTIDLTTSALAVNAYTFYANATNALSNASACSSVNVAYTLNACPTNYVSVPHNTALGTTTDFCVAKYEMKCVGTSCPTATPGANAVATSQAAGNPWVSISQTNSKTACTNLNAINGVVNKYYLISNPEWMTLARNIEGVAANWSTSLGVGILNRGWVHTSNTAVAPSTGAGCLYNTAGNTCLGTGSHEYKRTHALSNSEETWDISGNVWEWVDWQVTPANKAFIAALPINVDRGWKEFSELNSNIGIADEMKPISWEPFYPALGGAGGIGRYYAGVNTSGGAALRGGAWSHGTHAGVFALSLNYSAGSSSSSVGFRCVYRP